MLHANLKKGRSQEPEIFGVSACVLSQIVLFICASICGRGLLFQTHRIDANMAGHMAATSPIVAAVTPGAGIKKGTHLYTIGNELDRGGFGTVYLAQRTSPLPVLDVVVKVPAGFVLTDPVYSAKFEREATILANISHRNVVRIIDFWKFSSGEMALVQEYVKNAQKLTPYIRSKPTSASSVLVQALYAMRAFHRGAVHRDISPANILIDASGTVRIIDFGLAKEDPRVGIILTVTGTWFGTPGCMAPEQIDAKHVDQRADLYGLGRSITAALQGRNPMHAEPTQLPEPWRTICLKLCEHHADDRYQSADEALEAILALFSAAAIPLDEFEIHVDEMSDKTLQMPSSWSDACRVYFNQFSDMDNHLIDIAARLRAEAFAGGFDANSFFDRVETGSAVAAFDAFNVSFDDCDPLGKLYRRIYGYIDSGRKIKCFRRLCRTAVRWHRYSVMHDVRSAFAQEHDPAIQQQLLGILAQEDAGNVIHGRGVIPGRSP